MDPTQHQQLMAALNHVTGFLERIALAIEQISLEMPERPSTVTSLGSSSLGAIVDSVVPQLTLPLKTFGEDVANWLCPIHHDFKVVPAGVSKKTGKPYTAFIACGSPGCNEKPPRFTPAEQQLQRLP